MVESVTARKHEEIAAKIYNIFVKPLLSSCPFHILRHKLNYKQTKLSNLHKQGPVSNKCIFKVIETLCHYHTQLTLQ